MQEKGFDRSRPITIWSGKGVVVDGHARLQAAKNLGLEEVPVVESEFEDETAALQYAIHNQSHRRYIAYGELRAYTNALDEWLNQSEGNGRVEVKCEWCQHFEPFLDICCAERPWQNDRDLDRFVFHPCLSFKRRNLESPLG